MAAKVVFILAFIVLFFGLVEALPTGPDFFNITSNETSSGSGNPTEVNISGGYIAGLNVTATVQNSRWKAFVGWVDGKFTLDDSSGSSVYDWSLSTTEGEVYATRASGSIVWGSIACASAGEITAEDTAMDHSAGDNITSTFSSTNTGTYIVSGTTIGVGDCSSVNTYIDNATQSSSFEEFILYDTSNIVFATEIEDAVGGYDGVGYDFQMIVPESGNETFTGATAYYLYVELS